MAPQIALSLLQRLPIALVLLVCANTTPATADHSFDINPHPSPEASTALVCPNDNPSECYPSLFQPTIHFQKIRPNQSLPPGLHVRLNIQTGEKEARLNVPEGIDENKDAIVVIDDVPHLEEKALGIVEEGETPLQLRLQDAPKQAEHARPYSPPRSAPSADPNEAIHYEAALSIIKQKILVPRLRASTVVYTSGVADALETLTELAHSLEWGLAICRNADLGHSLLVSITPVHHLEYIDPELRSVVLLLMATAIQNNPDALAALLEHDTVENGYQVTLQSALSSLNLDGSAEGADSSIVARAIFFLSQLCANDGVMQAFSGPAVNGLSLLLEVFLASPLDADRGQLKIRHRIANFMEDHAEQIAGLYLGDGRKTLDAGTKEFQTLLRSWCRTLESLAEKHKEDDLVGTIEAKREIERVLKAYTGEGCHGGVDLGGPQEL